MTIIRRRVATRGAATDAFPGLGVKAYAVRERGVLGSPVNQYAPFYLLADPAGMNQFLFGPPFAGLSVDFGRPVVRHWTGVAFRPGPARADSPTAATRAISSLPAEVPVADIVHAAIADLDAAQDTAGLHNCALAVDPATWERCSSASGPRSQRTVGDSGTNSYTSRRRTCRPCPTPGGDPQVDSVSTPRGHAALASGGTAHRRFGRTEPRVKHRPVGVPSSGQGAAAATLVEAGRAYVPCVVTCRLAEDQRADQPPSEAITCPVIHSASSLTSQATRRAVSVGVLHRRPGLAAATAARVRSSA